MVASPVSCLGEIRLTVDGANIGFGYQLLMVSLAYRKRAVPISWTRVKHVRGHNSANKKFALLNYVRRLLPEGRRFFWLGGLRI